LFGKWENERFKIWNGKFKGYDENGFQMKENLRPETDLKIVVSHFFDVPNPMLDDEELAKELAENRKKFEDYNIAPDMPNL